MAKLPTENRKVLDFVNESAALAQPDKIVWIDGSEKQLKKLRKQACKSGEMIALNQKNFPAVIITERRKTTLRA